MHMSILIDQQTNVCYDYLSYDLIALLMFPQIVWFKSGSAT